MYKIIGIAGSPRRNGNSTTLLRQILQGAEESGAAAQTIYLNDLTFRGCQACDGCVNTGECVLKDELTPHYPKLREAGIWILASPVYFDGVSGQTKLFFDRCRCFAMEKGNLKGKRHAAIILTYEDRPRDDYQGIAERLDEHRKKPLDFPPAVKPCMRLSPHTAWQRRQPLCILNWHFICPSCI